MKLSGITDKVLEAWVYSHPIAGGCGSGPDVPEPTADERSLTALQLQNAQNSAGINEAMLPFVLKGMGLERIPQDDGSFVFQELLDPEKDARNKLRGEIELEANSRTLRALQGNLDVDPSVEKDIERGESQLREELFRKLGPGAEGSDAWNRAISEFQRGSNSLRYGIRHGEMTTADAIASNRETLGQRRQGQSYSQQQQMINPYTTSANILASAKNPMQKERFFQADIDQRNHASKNQLIGTAISGAAAAGGMYAGAQ